MCTLIDIAEEVVVEDSLCLYYVDKNGFPVAVKEKYDTEAEATAGGLAAIKINGIWLGETVFPYYCTCGARFCSWEDVKNHIVSDN